MTRCIFLWIFPFNVSSPFLVKLEDGILRELLMFLATPGNSEFAPPPLSAPPIVPMDPGTVRVGLGKLIPFFDVIKFLLTKMIS